MSHFDECALRVPDDVTDGHLVELVCKQDVSPHSAGSLYRARNRIASNCHSVGTLSDVRGVIHKD